MEDYRSHKDAVDGCVAFLRRRLPFLPEVVIQLGTGLGDLADRIDAELVLPYGEIPHFPQSTVTSHHGNLLIGRLAGVAVAVLQGRFHFYEGYSTRQVTLPIRVLALLGAKTLIVTNAAGGLNPAISPGSIMVIRDHLNFLGENPLRGPNWDEWGPRFPDLSEPYSPALINLARQCAADCGLTTTTTGVYVCIPGPSLETPAETRWLRSTGADAVGMSSVPEVIVARHAGMSVVGLSVIANVNDPDNFQPIALADILATADRAAPQLAQLVAGLIAKLPPEPSPT